MEEDFVVTDNCKHKRVFNVFYCTSLSSNLTWAFPSYPVRIDRCHKMYLCLHYKKLKYFTGSHLISLR